MEDDLRWKTTFEGRQPSIEDDLPWKMTFDGKEPLVGDHPKGGRRPSLRWWLIGWWVIVQVIVGDSPGDVG